MPRLIPPLLGNGKRPSDPAFRRASAPGMPGPNPDTAIPVLDISEDTHELVGERHDQARNTDDDTQLLTGALVRIDNPLPLGADHATCTEFVIGASTLHEAATEVIGALVHHAEDMPQWVASTDSELAETLAEHYTVRGYSTCKAIPLEEASS